MSKKDDTSDSSNDSSDDLMIDEEPAIKKHTRWLKVKCDDSLYSDLLDKIDDAGIKHKALDHDAMALISRDARVFREQQEKRRQQRQDPKYLEKRMAYYKNPEIAAKRKQYNEREDVKKRRLEQARKRREFTRALIQHQPTKALRLAQEFGVKLLPRSYQNGHTTNSKLSVKEPGEGQGGKEKKENTGREHKSK